MPLVYQQNINADTKIGVWHIAESEGFFEKRVTIQNVISHPHKRLQHLAGRYLLTELFDDFPLSLILIADTRKPYLENEMYHFSISHCGDYAAVIASSSGRVGVDIEIPRGKIQSLKEKFLIRDELKLLTILPFPELQQLTIGWSIKEAMFKWYGNGKVDFRKHLRITKLAHNNGKICSDCIFHKTLPVELKGNSILIEDNFLTWIVH
jgi:phosphopantetheinyl transferase